VHFYLNVLSLELRREICRTFFVYLASLTITQVSHRMFTLFPAPGGLYLMKCPNCQTENPEGSAFCRKCGNSLHTKTTCPECGHENLPDSAFCNKCGQPLTEQKPAPVKTRLKKPSTIQPTSFANGRYQVKKFLGEGGKKKVYLAHDTLLDRDVAFALIKTENLDDKGKKRITREARAMGRLGDHPHIVTVYDIGEHEGQPYMVLPLLPGGDVEGLIEKAPEHKLSLGEVVDIAKAVCRGLVFAHGKGIIHRDLKPGNIWLSADGTAKIGDFGLAVAVDLSRLTQSGMMVGTVSYMPPEQAMGGQVSEKADLYSLGAMLYEMVTGRPPFVGDDSVSIIGQHINTPPVSPIWHRADLPPALETLIMQLLEKDPDKRPASAADVLQALESIDAVKSEPAKEASTMTENPLYRKVFVGREPELRQLQSAFDSAVSGQGALMMVVGEPGIGKTAICDQLRTYVTLRGGKTLLGHCYEEGSLSLPYLAFVEAMRSYVLSREVKDLREELGTGAADVARIVSEIREKLKVKPRPKGDPEEERYRLMQAVTGFLSNAANVQPLLVVLEDLHDSDKGTLDMLTHVSRHLAGTRLLIVGTYRDVEVDRSHPLSAALAELRRISTYGRVLLRGLNPDEVRRMLEGITREEIPWSLAEAVHRQTEGNPLFVQEVVRYLAEERLITQKEGHWRPAKDTPLEMSIPEGLRDVIGKRLSLISKECNQLLSIAAVIGRDFRLEVLQKVSGLTEEEVFNALEEAKKAAVVEERTGVGAAVTYRFAHAFFRQTLYEETIAPRRIRLHQQVARALEEIYAGRLEEHAAELAEHFSHSSDNADLEKSVSYGEMAAKRAMDVYAYGEAVRLLDQAVKVQEILDPEDKAKRCDLLLDLCDALLNVPDARRIIEMEAPAALAMAENIGDDSRAARVCIAAGYAFAYEQGVGVFTPERVRWAEHLDRYARPDTAERVWADASFGLRKYVQGDNSEGKRLLTQALDMAHRTGEIDSQQTAASWLLHYSSAPQYTEERLRLAEEVWAGPQVKMKSLIRPETRHGAGEVFLAMGQRERAEEVWDDLRDEAARSGHFRLQLQSVCMDAVTSVMDGRLVDAIAMVEKILARGEQDGFIGVARLFANHPYYRICVYCGEHLEEIERENSVSLSSPMAFAVLGWIQSYLGRKAEVSEILEKYVVQRPGIGTDEDETRFWVETLFLESAVIVGHRQAAELLLKRLNVPGLYTTGVSFPTCIIRHLGGAAALLERYDEARKYYQEAIKVCTEMPFRPELALSRLQLAEMLLEHYPDEKKEALEHLDFAIKEFREMKMQPSLERALRHKDILTA
jgi:tetratricopeptide (TPR) repeat protein